MITSIQELPKYRSKLRRMIADNKEHFNIPKSFKIGNVSILGYVDDDAYIAVTDNKGAFITIVVGFDEVLNYFTLKKFDI